MISILASPATLVIRLLGLPKIWSLIAVRSSLRFRSHVVLTTVPSAGRFGLAAFVTSGFGSFHRAVSRRFGREVSQWLVLLCCLQFHFPFYMSRPLPNTFALGWVLYGFARWVDGDHRRCLFVLIATMTVFRGELLILAAPIALSGLIQRLTAPQGLASSSPRPLLSCAVLGGETVGIGFLEGIGIGVAAGLVALVVTVPLDSLFWKRLLWPEGEACWPWPSPFLSLSPSLSLPPSLPPSRLRAPSGANPILT